MGHPAQEERLSPRGSVGSKKPCCPARYALLWGTAGWVGVSATKGTAPAVAGCTRWSMMDEGMAPGSPFCWDVESRRDAARSPRLAPVLESRVVVMEMHGERNKWVCNPAPGCQCAMGQPVSLRWSLQRSQEGTRELGTGAKGTRSKGARSRYAGSSRDVSCTEAGDAQRCLPVPWEQKMALETQEGPGPLGAGWASRGVSARGAGEWCGWGRG